MREIPSAPSEWSFVDVAAEAGVRWVQRSGTEEQKYIVEVKSTGVALFDYDGDGLLDLFFTAGSTVERYRKREPGFGCRLFRNQGKMRFIDITELSGIRGASALPAMPWACGVAAADVDADGRTDLLVTGIGEVRLLLNRAPTGLDDHRLFVDRGPVMTGLKADGWQTSAAFADLDGDRDLDLYVCGYVQFDFANPPVHGGGHTCLWRNQPVACGPRGLPATHDWVYENLGDGTFKDVSEAWGFRAVEPRYALAVLAADLKGDATPEIYVVNDAGPNYLFEKQGDKFVEIGALSGAAYSADGAAQSGMGVDAADLDGDGRLDLLVTNFEQEANNAYRNVGDGRFTDYAERYGLGAPSVLALSWGVGAYDFDGNGQLDLFVANGHVYPQADGREGYPGYKQTNQMYRGERRAEQPWFRECGRDVGFTAPHAGRAAAFGDLDNDGDVDIVVCNLNEPPSIWENRPPAGNRFLVLTLCGEKPNADAIGARVEVAIGEVRRVLEVRRQSSFQASHDPRLFIGLGTKSPAGSALVRWPDGKRERFAIAADTRAATLTRGSGEAVD